ncbi:MAG: transglutaminase domain-containing protein [Acidimicrobiales bacterium]
MQRYLLNQTFHYDYETPIRQLEQRLMVVPPAAHGDQRRLEHRVKVDGAVVRTASRRDGFGNHVVHVRALHVEQAIEFDTWVEVERDSDLAAPALPVTALRDRRYTQPSWLTRPSQAVIDAARQLRARSSRPVELAESITSWVNGAFSYSHDATTVRTTAAEALDLGAGVCQDYAHVMLSISRACGLAARYVSGHLVGEGGTHAWVEVLVEDPDRPGLAMAVAFDPTHDRKVHNGYVTVAVGRDYSDVAPTSGTFRSPGMGRLSCRKRLELTDDRSEAALAAC